MKRLNFIVPIKHFAQAKSRLTTVLSGTGREQLASQLYFQNLRWLRYCYPQHNVLVVTPDIRAAKMARDLKADFILEERCEGLNLAVSKGTVWSEQQGFDTQVVFFPDIAKPKKEDMDTLLACAEGGKSLLALAVASDGGTNATLASPPSVTPLVFGRQSSKRIVAAAKEQKIPCYLLSLSSLALDVDRPEDLEQYRPQLRPMLQEVCV